MSNPQQALSVRQPYAWLIVKGYKPIENRSWRTWRRERVYIHASKSKAEMVKSVLAYCLTRLTFHRAARFMGAWHDMIFGAIIGEVDIVDCVTDSDDQWFEGEYGFVCANPELYKTPIPCKGRLGFFVPEGPEALPETAAAEGGAK